MKLAARLERLEARQRTTCAPLMVWTYREERVEGGRLVVTLELKPPPQEKADAGERVA